MKEFIIIITEEEKKLSLFGFEKSLEIAIQAWLTKGKLKFEKKVASKRKIRRTFQICFSSKLATFYSWCN